MAVDVAHETDLDAIASLVAHPSLNVEFEQWVGRVPSAFGDPYHPRELTWIARDYGAPVAFVLVYLLPTPHGRFAVTRIGVLDSHRRHGLGARLHGIATAAIRDHASDCDELTLSAWLPNDAAAAFAVRHGYAHARYFWLMERTGRGVSDLGMPDGVELRVFDGSATALAHYTEAYNASFARHYHYVQATIDDIRQLTAHAEFRRDGLALAYRDGRCVGFCRNELFESRGEIAVLGTIPEARRIGLGRALLRWGIQWLEAQDTPRITLLVDGENEDALGLYRSEGFEVTKTREVWSQPSSPAATPRAGVPRH